MPKGVPNKIYSGQFKVKVVDTMYAEHLSCPEEARRFSIQSETQVARWESIYPEEEKEALLVERRERACAASRMLKGRKPKRDIYLQINLVKHMFASRLVSSDVKMLASNVSYRPSSLNFAHASCQGSNL